MRSWVTRAHLRSDKESHDLPAPHRPPLPAAALALLGDIELPSEVQRYLDADALNLGRVCEWYASELEEKLITFARAACACAARRSQEAPPRIILAQWPSKKPHQVAVSLLIAAALREDSEREPLRTEEIDDAVHQLFSGKPDAPLIRRQLLGIGLLVDQKRSQQTAGLPKMVLDRTRLRFFWASHAGWVAPEPVT